MISGAGSEAKKTRQASQGAGIAETNESYCLCVVRRL